MSFPPYRPAYRPPPRTHPYSAAQSSAHKGWSTNNASNYSAVLEADSSGSRRKVPFARPGVRQTDQSTEATSKGIKGKDLGYAFIGKEADEYVRQELREQLGTGLVPPMPGDPTTPSPLVSAKVTPQMVVEEFKRAGHFDATRTQLLSTFQNSQHKGNLMQSLQAYLLQRLSDMEPDARQRLSKQDTRLQHLTLERWIEESVEAADIFDDMFEKLRGPHDGLFTEQGTVGKGLDSRLADVVLSERRRIEAKTVDSSDDEGDSTPLNKDSATPAHEPLSSSRGSQTPMAAPIAEQEANAPSSSIVAEKASQGGD